MTQKWNLQDIRPAEPRRRRPSQADMSQVPEVRQSAELRLDGRQPARDYDADTIVIKKATKASIMTFLLLCLGPFLITIVSAS